MSDDVVAVIGGTGKLGAALSRRLAKSGRKVIIGSRSAQNAAAAAEDLGFGLTGSSNAQAAAAANIVIVAVPFSAQQATLSDIAAHVAGKIVIDTTVPLVPPKVMRVQLPEGGSAALRAQSFLDAGTTVISGFHSVAAHKLITDEAIDCDVLIFGDDKSARAVGIELARQAGLRGLHGGPLVNSVAAESLTPILIFLNKTYNVDGAGIRITGTLSEPEE